MEDLASSKDEYTDSDDVTRTRESCIHVFIIQSHIPKPVSSGLRHHSTNSTYQGESEMEREVSPSLEAQHKGLRTEIL